MKILDKIASPRSEDVAKLADLSRRGKKGVFVNFYDTTRLFPDTQSHAFKLHCLCEFA